MGPLDVVVGNVCVQGSLGLGKRVMTVQPDVLFLDCPKHSLDVGVVVGRVVTCVLAFDADLAEILDKALRARLRAVVAA